MKGLYLLLFTVTVTTAYILNPPINIMDCPKHPGCPRPDGKFATHLPHETDCHKFYKCYLGRACVLECGSNIDNSIKLVFNPKLQVCDWPDNVPDVICNDAEPGDTSTDRTPPSTKPTPPSKVPTPPSTVPTPPSTKPTPPSTVPTPPSTKPTPPSTVPTPPSTKPTPPSTKPTPPSTVPTPPSTKPTPPSTVPTPPSTKPTPPSTVPTPPSTKPTPPSTVPTPPSTKPTPPSTEPTPPSTKPTPPSTKPTPPSTEPTNTPTSKPAYPCDIVGRITPGKCSPTEDMLIPHENDCNAYYKCYHGERLGPWYCQQGHVYNPCIEACDIAGSVDCEAIINGHTRSYLN